MKSKFFRSFDPAHGDNPTLGRHLATFMSMSSETREACIAAVPVLAAGFSKGEAKQEVVRLEAVTGQPPVVLEHVLSMLMFLARGLSSDDGKGDAPEDWAADLVEIGFLASDQKDAFRDIVRSVLTDVVPVFERSRRKALAAAGVLPYLNAVGTTVEIRGVQTKKYSFPDDVEAYVPAFDDYVGIVSVHLGLDRGPIDDVVFQLDEKALRLLLDKLTCAGRDLEHLERKLLSPERKVKGVANGKEKL